MKLRWALILSSLFVSLPSFGMTTLSQIKALGEDEFSLVFNGPIGRGQIDIEYLNDIVQLSIKGASIYPAKILPFEKGLVTKIFAYQYSPKLVRCRFSVRGKAEDYKEKLKMSTQGKSVSINFSPQEPVIAPISEEDVDEKALYEKVVNAGAVKHEQAASVVQAQSTKSAEESEKVVVQKTPAQAKLGSSVFGAFAKLGGVILLFLCIALGIKKLKVIRPENGSGILGAISQFAKGTLGKDPKVIQVVSTHYLDPKKSIAVIKVAGKLLVLGVSNESINLITQISEDASFDDYENIPEERIIPSPAHTANRRPVAGAQIFSELLYSEKEKPALGTSESTAILPNARSRIRSRLEGLKPL